MSMSPKKKLALELSARANQKNATLTKAAEMVGIEKDRVRSWLSGGSIPTNEELEKLGTFFDCDVDELKKLRAEAEAASDIMPKPVDATPVPEAAPEPPKEEEKTKETPVKETAPVATVEPTPSEETKPVKKERKPRTPKTPVTENTPVPEKEDAPVKKTRAPRQSKGKNKAMFSEETESFIRKTAGLKKTDELTKDAVFEAFKVTGSQMKQQLSVLESLEKEVVKALYQKPEVPEPVKLDDKYQKLVDAAMKASDEGYDMALSILKKFKK